MVMVGEITRARYFHTTCYNIIIVEFPCFISMLLCLVGNINSIYTLVHFNEDCLLELLELYAALEYRILLSELC